MHLTLPSPQGEGCERVDLSLLSNCSMLWTTVFPEQSYNLEACVLLLEEKVPKADEVKIGDWE